MHAAMQVRAQDAKKSPRTRKVVRGGGEAAESATCQMQVGMVCLRSPLTMTVTGAGAGEEVVSV